MTTVYLARGHGIQPSGRHDPGAVGNGWSEQDAADVVAPIIAADLASAGVDVIDEGEDDPNYVGSVDAANAAGVDLFVSLHWDWTGGLDVHAFHHSTSTVGEDLATSIVDRLGAAGFPLADNPVRDRDELYVIGRTSMPAVLVEHGKIGAFGTDPVAHLERLGIAVAAGILDHLGLTPPPQEEPMSYTDRDRAIAATTLDRVTKSNHALGRIERQFGPGAVQLRELIEAVDLDDVDRIAAELSANLSDELVAALGRKLLGD